LSEAGATIATMTSDKWYLRAKRHHDNLGRLVQPNMLLMLDVRVTGNAERLGQMVATGNWVQVPNGMSLLPDADD
jgi:hypothetical protein